jgi:hypothetical protein
LTVIDWVEPEDGILAYRYPMQDREIQNGGKLTVRDSQTALTSVAALYWHFVTGLWLFQFWFSLSEARKCRELRFFDDKTI